MTEVLFEFDVALVLRPMVLVAVDLCLDHDQIYLQRTYLENQHAARSHGVIWRPEPSENTQRILRSAHTNNASFTLRRIASRDQNHERQDQGYQVQKEGVVNRFLQK